MNHPGWWVGNVEPTAHRSWPAPLRAPVDALLFVYRFLFVRWR